MDDTVTHLGPWECFEDRSYYDMWCVRQVHDREFGHGFHLVNGEEAARLRDFLNTRIAHQPDSALADELRQYDRPDACIGRTQYIPISRATLRRIITALGDSNEPS